MGSFEDGFITGLLLRRRGGADNGVIRAVIASDGLLNIVMATAVSGNNGMVEQYEDNNYTYVESTFTKSKKYMTINRANNQSNIYTKTFTLELVTQVSGMEGELLYADVDSDVPKVKKYYDRYPFRVNNQSVEEEEDPDAKEIYVKDWSREPLPAGESKTAADAAAVAWAIARNQAKAEDLAAAIREYEAGAKDIPAGAIIVGETSPDTSYIAGDSAVLPGGGDLSKGDGLYYKIGAMTIDNHYDEWFFSWSIDTSGKKYEYWDTAQTQLNTISYGMIKFTLTSADGTKSYVGYQDLEGYLAYGDTYDRYDGGNHNSIYRPIYIQCQKNYGLYMRLWRFNDNGSQGWSLGYRRAQIDVGYYPTVDDCINRTNLVRSTIFQTAFNNAVELSSIPYTNN